MRDALSLLDQIMAYSEPTISHEEVLEILGAVDRNVLFTLCGALLRGHVVSALNILDDLYRRGHDLKRLYSQLLEHLRHLVVAKLDDGQYNLIEVPVHEMDLLKAQAEELSLETIHQIFTVVFEAEASIRFSSQPRIALEALFVRLLQLKNRVSLDQIIAGIDRVANTFERPAENPSPGQVELPPPSNEMVAENKTQRHDNRSTEPKPLVQTWKRLLSACDEQCKSLVPILEKAFLSEVGKDYVVITVGANSFFSARLRDEKNSAKIKQVCSQLFGRDMAIRFAEQPTNNRAHGKPSKETDKARALRKEALSHPIVTDALDVFQGTVVDIKML